MVLEKENSEFKLALVHRKFDLPMVEGLDKYIHTWK